MDFRVPELGEGIEVATVVRVLVAPGAAVREGQDIVELETEKATMPMPAPGSGTIESIAVKPGDKVKPGAVLMTAKTANTPEPARFPVGSASATPQALVVPMKPQAPIPVKPQAAIVVANGNGAAPVAAGPATRRLARELGVDLQQVAGTARGGRVTQDDVKAFVRGLPKIGEAAPAHPAISGFATPPLPDFSKYGPIEKKPFTSLRKAVAKNVTLSWNVAPQVTQHDLADVTELEAGRKRFVDSSPKDAPKVTMTVLAIKALVAAVKALPHFNASYDPSAGDYGELILKRYYNIGIAVDTERGLLVPVIRDADRKGIAELARELADLAEKARAGKLTLEEMRGGTFTITNLGGIGGTAFSPIINYPEVAILGLSRSAWQPVVRDGKIEPRLLLPLSLTYDHRVIDGADGARFITRLSAAFADPMRLLFES